MSLQKTGCEPRDSQPDDETRFRSKNYFGFFFDFFGVSLDDIVGSALVFAGSARGASAGAGAAIASWALMSVVVGVSDEVVGAGIVGVVLVPGLAGTVWGAVWAIATLERPIAAMPMIKLRIILLLSRFIRVSK